MNVETDVAPGVPEEMVPATVPELARFLAANSQGDRNPVLPVGGRTSLGFGFAADPASLVVATSRLDRVIDYPARDMTVTVEAGCRVATLQELLRSENQRLPVDIPLAHRATLGGAIVSAAAGPRRYGMGTLRDYVIGIGCITVDGQRFKAGGRVVKNVAGYDLCKLMVGSGGTLAVVAEVTLKLKPLPASSAMGWGCFDKGEVVQDLLSDLAVSRARPVAIELLGPKAGRQVAAESRQDLPVGPLLLGVGLEGSDDEVSWQVDVVDRELRSGGAGEVVWVRGAATKKMWSSLTDFQVGGESPVTIRAVLKPSRTVEFVQAAIDSGVSVQAHAGNGVVHGHLPDETVDVGHAKSLIESLRELAADSGGQVIVERCETDWANQLSLWGAGENDWPLMDAVKREFDPARLLSPGRGIDGALACASEVVHD
ncbi:FAD-binding oxidoreductase [Planctomycetaceae bacterium]|nr:FAD-binding oxidoreductase [Planctomycetaceae bacterium]